MKKETVEIWRDEHQLSGYAYLSPPKIITKDGIFDFLVDWSKDKNITIENHSIKREEVNFDKYKEKYKLGDLEIPYCDWVYYVDIWHQEK